MYPTIGGLSTYYLCWAAAAVVAFAARRHLIRTQQAALPESEQVPWRPLVFAAVGLTLPIGAKLLFVLEVYLFRSGTPAAALGTVALGDGFRLPGGVLLLGLAAPVICSVARLPPLRAIDAALPVLGLCICVVRIGCFLNGCCFGRVSAAPWAVTFPNGSMAHLWHASLGYVALSAPRSAPVEPLQLYFAAAGLLLFIAGQRWYRRRRFDGEVWIKCFLLFFGSSFLLELLRGYELTLNLATNAAGFVLTALVAIRMWPAVPVRRSAG